MSRWVARTIGFACSGGCSVLGTNSLLGSSVLRSSVPRVCSRPLAVRVLVRTTRRGTSMSAGGNGTSGGGGMPFARGTPAGEAIAEAAGRFASAFAAGDAAAGATKIEAVARDGWDAWVEAQDAPTRAWLAACRKVSAPSAGSVVLVPTFSQGEGETGALRALVVGLDDGPSTMWTAAEVAKKLPANTPYTFADLPDGVSKAHIEIGWGLAAYSYKLYKKSKSDSGKDAPASLVRLCSGREAELVDATLASIYMVRDLITTPTEDMGPASLESAVFKVGSMFDAECSAVVGNDLLKDDTYFPQVHMVGRAAAPDRAPRLLELRWNKGTGKKVTLVGKGVCYDTGGLSMKSTAGMLQMKKDMGGSAHVLALGFMIMKMNLDVDLRVLIPCVENAVGPDSYRPGDVIVARNNLTTEVTNTDAEGRLILADALVAACEESPELVVDFATLTGAQRIALGPDIPSFWTTSEEIAKALDEKCALEDDLMWRLPLHKPYRKTLDSSIADVKNCGSSGQGGAITAALYLKEFVDDKCPWIHVDLSAYNLSSRPGRPEGGEAMGLRAMFALVESLSKSSVDMTSV